MNEVRIESVEKDGRTYWRVRLGQRGLTFQQELAARAFAAQLHVRMGWLRGTAAPKQE